MRRNSGPAWTGTVARHAPEWWPGMERNPHKQLLEHAGEVFDNGNPAVEDAERRIRDLQAKVGELTMERDFLSGALGRFGLPSAKR